MNRLMLAVGLLALVPLAQAADQTVYVQSYRAKIQQGPALSAAVVTMAPRGEALAVLKQQGDWYKVQYKSQQGWVNALMVAARPPMERVSVFDRSASQTAGNDARRRASSVTVVGAVRGLSAEERSRAHAEEQADYAALEKLNAQRLEEKEVLSFLQEGLAHGK